MCNTQDTHTHQAHHIPHNQPTTNSNRNRTDLGAEYDRSRGGNGPISVRKRTDLGTGLDRSREMNAVLATQQVC